MTWNLLFAYRNMIVTHFAILQSVLQITIVSKQKFGKGSPNTLQVWKIGLGKVFSCLTTAISDR